MIAFLKDLPDGGLGVLAAGTAHLALCFGILAPRAMEAHLDEVVAPPCIEMLQAEQERAIERARAGENEKRERATRELNRVERELGAYRQVAQTYDQTGLSDLFRGLGIASPSDSLKQLEHMQAQADRMRAALSQAPDFSHLELPSSELVKTCSCAALKAAAGSRTSYALSLASFRLIEPEDITRVGDAAMSIAAGSTCGQIPWRNS